MTAAPSRAPARPGGRTADGGPDIRPPASARHRRRGRVPRPVLVIGGLAGAAAAGYAFSQGFRPGHGWGLLLGGFFTWLALAAVCVTGIEVVRRHWRVMRAKSWSGATGLAARGRDRYARRGGVPLDDPDDPALTLHAQDPAAPQPPPAPWPPPGPDPRGPEIMPSPPGPDSEKTAPRAASPRVRSAAARVIRVPLVRGTPPATWAALIAEIAPFVPEHDEDLLDWFRDQIVGMNGYAEALADVYEACYAQIGLVPAAIGAVHDTADAVAEASGSMAQARQVFAEYFAGFRQWAADGGDAPFDGRWITGEGDEG